MRDVNYGWLLRYLHSNGASFFFVAVYAHIVRGMYYGSYKDPREVLWILGVILFLLMVVTGFMEYVLPWGQMSFAAAIVITNLFSAIPWVGDPIVTWLWGGFAVGNPTLNRFYSLHYLLPFVIAGVVMRISGRCIWSGRTIRPASSRRPRRTRLRSRPMATVKDAFFIGVFCLFLAWFVFYIPNYLGHSDNYIPANPGQTPTHIVPNGTTCRSTPSCARSRTSFSASSRCSPRSCCSPSCPGSIRHACARRITGRSTGNGPDRLFPHGDRARLSRFAATR